MIQAYQQDKEAIAGKLSARIQKREVVHSETQYIAEWNRNAIDHYGSD